MSKTIDVREVARRLYWGEDEARVVVAAWQASGERVSSFARRYGVDRRRVARWARRLASPAPVRFHQVRVIGSPAPAASADAIEIELPGGPRVRLPRGFDAEDLRRLWSVVQADRPC